MTPTLKYGFIGCGMMGHEHLRNLALIPGSEVVAIVEPDAGMRSTAQTLAPQASFEPDITTLLARQDLDALIITTPNYQHAGQLLEIFAHTRLPVLVEKPLCTDLQDVARLRAAAAQHPAPVWVAMEYRYMPPIAALREQLARQALGEVKMLAIREHRFPFLEKVGDWNRFNRNTGGTLVEKCCHFFDLMRLLLDSESVRVFASGGVDVNHLDERYDGATPDILDNAYVIVDFADGKRALLDLCMFAEGSRYQEEISVTGSQAKLECFIPGPGRFWPEASLGAPPTPQLVLSPRDPKGPQVMDIPVDAALLAAGDHNGSTYYQHLGFRRAILEQGKVEVSVDDGLRAVVIGMAAQAAIASGRAMRLTEAGFSFAEQVANRMALPAESAIPHDN
ncbi:MAG: Gfo/Idh/MocA family oxidoreductase [Thiolinea sp.]